MRRELGILALGALFFALPACSAAQDTSAVAVTPCKAATCRLVWDWGSGNTAASFPHDRRYGPASDLEVYVPQYMGEMGFKLSTAAGEGMTMTLRPRMRNAMCDQMAGTGTSYDCRTVQEMQVQFSNAPAGTKLPSAQRITNRCGAGDTFMTIKDFARYAADMMAYQLTPERERGKRPVTKC
jgi:hypothetical protein